MPKEGFVTVTLKKNLIERLDRMANNQPTSTAVTRAIQFYLDSYVTEAEIEMKQSPLGYRGLTGTNTDTKLLFNKSTKTLNPVDFSTYLSPQS